jgi:hypothetical protein
MHPSMMHALCQPILHQRKGPGGPLCFASTTSVRHVWSASIDLAHITYGVMQLCPLSLERAHPIFFWLNSHLALADHADSY